MEIKQEFVSHKLSSVVEGRGGGEPWRKEGKSCTGGGRRGGRKMDS